MFDDIILEKGGKKRQEKLLDTGLVVKKMVKEEIPDDQIDKYILQQGFSPETFDETHNRVKDILRKSNTLPSKYKSFEELGQKIKASGLVGQHALVKGLTMGFFPLEETPDLKEARRILGDFQTSTLETTGELAGMGLGGKGIGEGIGLATKSIIKKALPKLPVMAQKAAQIAGESIGWGGIGAGASYARQKEESKPINVKEVTKEGLIWASLPIAFGGLGLAKEFASTHPEVWISKFLNLGKKKPSIFEETARLKPEEITPETVPYKPTIQSPSERILAIRKSLERKEEIPTSTRVPEIKLPYKPRLALPYKSTPTFFYKVGNEWKEGTEGTIPTRVPEIIEPKPDFFYRNFLYSGPEKLKSLVEESHKYDFLYPEPEKPKSLSEQEYQKFLKELLTEPVKKSIIPKIVSSTPEEEWQNFFERTKKKTFKPPVVKTTKNLQDKQPSFNIQEVKKSPIIKTIPKIVLSTPEVKLSTKQEIIKEVKPLEMKQGVQGNLVTAFDQNNIEYQTRYEVIEGKDLITSHDTNLRPNPQYPKELQPRDREKIALKLQVDNLSKKLNPDLLLADTKSLQTGTPIVGTTDNLVESGNARTIALMKSPNYKGYKQLLINKSEVFGIPKEMVEKMEKPILIRRRTTEMPINERIDFTRKANISEVAQMSATEIAQVDARRLSDDIVGMFQQPESMSPHEALLSPVNKDFLNQFFKGLSPNEYAQLVDEKGYINKAGVDRVVNSLLMKTLGKNQIIGQMIESPESNVKNIATGILRSLGKLNKMEGSIRIGEKNSDYSISNDIIKVTEVLQKLRREGKSVNEYLKQMSLFEKELNPFQEELLKAIVERSKSAKQIKELLENYSQKIIDMPSIKQPSFVGFIPPSKNEILNESITNTDLQKQMDLFSTSLRVPEIKLKPEIQPRPNKPATEHYTKIIQDYFVSKDKFLTNSEFLEGLLTEKVLNKEGNIIISPEILQQESNITLPELFETIKTEYLTPKIPLKKIPKRFPPAIGLSVREIDIHPAFKEAVNQFSKRKNFTPKQTKSFLVEFADKLDKAIKTNTVDKFFETFSGVQEFKPIIQEIQAHGESVIIPHTPPVLTTTPQGPLSSGIKLGGFGKIREYVEDSLLQLKKLQQLPEITVNQESDPYKMETLYHGRKKYQIEDVKKIVENIDKEVFAIEKETKDKNIYEKINKFMIATHTPERNAIHGEGASGMTTPEAMSILTDIDRLPYANKIKDVANQLWELNRQTLDILEKGQIITSEFKNKLQKKYPNHVPLQRIFEEAKNKDISHLFSMDVKTTGIKRAKGSQLEVADITENIAMNYLQAIERVERNRINISTANLVRENKDVMKELGIYETKLPKLPVAKIEHRAAIDKDFQDELVKFAESLGAKFKTAGQPNKKLGLYESATKEITRKFATPREVLSHEVAHFFDDKFGLKKQFYLRGQSKEMVKEITDFMLDVMNESPARIKKPEERFADGFEWWLTHRDLAQKDMPLFSDKMQEIIEKIPDLKPILNIKPKPKFSIEQMEETIFRRQKFTNDPRILSYFEKGKPQYIKIEDPHLALVMRGANQREMGDVVRVAQVFTRLWSQLATRFNIDFPFANKIRDMEEVLAYVSSKNEMGRKGIAKVISKQLHLEGERAVIDFLRGKDTQGAKLYKELRDVGGTTGGVSLKNIRLDINKIRKTNRSSPRKAVEMLIKGFDNWNTIFEDSSRYIVYKSALERGLSKDDAAYLAKNASINFDKRGTGGQIINAMYMFANPSIQGSAKMLRVMRDKPSIPLAIGAIFVGAHNIANNWNSKIDPKWRDNITKWDKINSLNFLLPDGEYYTTFPVSWGLKPFNVLAEQITSLTGGFTTKKDAFSNIISSVIQSTVEGYNPMGGTNITSALTPTIADLPADIMRNVKWSGGKIRPDFDPNDPKSIQYFPDLEKSITGKITIKTTKKLSEYGEKLGTTKLEFSPADVKYAYEQLTSGAGKSVSKTIDTISSLTKGKMPEITRVPIISRFVKRIIPEVSERSKEKEAIKLAISQQEKRRFYRKQEAQKEYENLRLLPVDKANEKLAQYRINNPILATGIEQIIKQKSEPQLTTNEKVLLNLSIENRANYIARQIINMPAEKRQAYYNNLANKGIITSKMQDQMRVLLQKIIE